MQTSFEPAFQRLMASEGGYVNHPRDPGGATNLGVTQRTYDAWRSQNGLPRQTVRDVSMDEARNIFRDMYWNPVGGDNLPVGLDYALTDFAYNSGPAQALRTFQRTLGVDPSGRWDEATQQALGTAQANLPQTIGQLTANRRAFLQGLDTWDDFGTGWNNRLNEVNSAAVRAAQNGSWDGAPPPPAATRLGDSAIFNPSAYLAANPDVAAAGVDPYTHWLTSGDREGRLGTFGLPPDYQPIAGFSSPMDPPLRPGFLPGDLPPTRPAPDALTPNLGMGLPAPPGPLYGFDTEAYKTANPDVAAAGVDPLRHFAESGWKENRPGAVSHVGDRDFAGLFSPAAYLFNNPDVKSSGLDPWQHFMRYGVNEGRQGAGLTNLGVPSMLHPKAPGYAFGGYNTETADPYDFSDNIGYSPNAFPGGVASFPGAPPAFGSGAGAPIYAGDLGNPAYTGTVTVRPYSEDPNAQGWAERYIGANPDVGQSGMNPFEHYEKYGAAEGRGGGFGFDPGWFTDADFGGYGGGGGGITPGVVPGGSDYGTFPGHFGGTNMGGTEDLARALSQNEAAMAEQARQQAEFLRQSQERDRQAQALFDQNMARNNPPFGGGAIDASFGGGGIGGGGQTYF
jgi:lysozyme family protein